MKRVVIGKPNCLPTEQAKLHCSIWDDCINQFILLIKSMTLTEPKESELLDMMH